LSIITDIEGEIDVVSSGRSAATSAISTLDDRISDCTDDLSEISGFLAAADADAFAQGKAAEALALLEAA
jgi:hypothetical protein